VHTHLFSLSVGKPVSIITLLVTAAESDRMLLSTAIIHSTSHQDAQRLAAAGIT